MIRIVNLRNYKLCEGEVLIKVDRSSVVGNPFFMHDESMRDEVCNKYQRYFDGIVDCYLNTDAINYNIEFINYLNNIIKIAHKYDIALGCWCAPKRCHAETIKTFIDNELSI